MKKYLIENNEIIKVVVLNTIEETLNYPYKDGWRDEKRPEYDPRLQTLGEKYYDPENDIVTFFVVDLTIDLNEVKQRHYDDVTNTVKEISSIVSAVKNVYDPLRDTPQNIPPDFVTLVRQVQALRQRAYDEIAGLTTPEAAVSYVVRGPEVEGYINLLKSFI